MVGREIQGRIGVKQEVTAEISCSPFRRSARSFSHCGPVLMSAKSAPTRCGDPARWKAVRLHNGSSVTGSWAFSRLENGTEEDKL
jgi:hypothetical protein